MFLNRTSLAGIAAGVATALSGVNAQAADGPEVVLVPLRDMGRDLASVGGQLDQVALEMAPVQADLERANAAREKAVNQFGANSPDALAQDRAMADARSKMRQIAIARLEPLLPRLAQVQTFNRNKIDAVRHSPAAYTRALKAWMAGRKNEPVVVMLAIDQATRRISEESYELYQKAILGDVKEALVQLKSTIDLVNKIAGPNAGPDLDDEIPKLLESSHDNDAPVDDLDKILRSQGDQ
jgi:hypothetical protein